MPRIGVIGSVLALASASQLVAQTTSSCMDMGGGMVHCNNMEMDSGRTSSTNCMDMGGGMASCTTTGMGGGNATADQQRGQFELGRALGSLLSGNSERSIRKKVGELLSSGDCLGAARYAYGKGLIELGNEVAQSCQRRTQQADSLQPVVPTSSADWRWYATSASGSEYFYDASSLEAYGEFRRVWTMVDHSDDKKANHQTGMALNSYDCKSMTSAVYSYSAYDENGRMLTNYTATARERVAQPLSPDSIGMALWEEVCLAPLERYKDDIEGWTVVEDERMATKKDE